MKAEITKVVMLAELNGETYQIALPPPHMRMLVQLAQSLSENGKLPVIKAPSNLKLYAKEPTNAS